MGELADAVRGFFSLSGFEVRVDRPPENASRVLRRAVPLVATRDAATDNNGATDTCLRFACIPAPCDLPPAAVDTLMARYLPLTAEAFGETIATMTPASRAEHQDHMVGGDLLVLAGLSGSAEGGVFRLAGHCLVRRFDDGRVMHIKGVLADTELRGLGIARALVEVAVAVCRPAFVTARTANVAIANLLWSMQVSPSMPLWPLGAWQTPGEDDVERKPIPRDVTAIGRLVAELMADDLAKYDAGAMAYRAVYEPDRRAVFSPTTSAAGDSDEGAPPATKPETVASQLLRRAIR
eukprot:CAMPEP_0174868720 /NCGR_PEP_ID=MMETSP1114-20130205/66534_1 /TAXON_ID=312471 /ORGANISM="Neobodo designis, Strain CCAP 1951/1" /LENGTH=293 /DNA_ID=CAMNT_0016103949 /DNA_START=48 /DNA_END=926 /DNA_ORIENTATION=+